MSADAPARRSLLRAALFGVTAVLGAGCDVGTKVWAEERLTDLPGQSLALIAPWLELSLQYNPGTAFSFVGDLGGGVRFVLGALSLLVVGVLLVMALRGQRLQALALGLIAGGAVGNGYDRLFRESGVVDFIRVNYPWGGSWPTFNVADALVAVGAALLVLEAMRAKRDAPPPEPDAAA